MPDSWPPRDEAQLRRAITNGLLVEDHHLDLKRELPPAPRNDPIAIDLAAFSIDGGAVFVGVDETSPPSIGPVRFEGLAERIEQIGRTRVDPPIHVRCVEIPVGANPGEGVLVVIVPPSPTAPHMVGHQYRARGDKTNYPMGDAEVERVRRGRTASVEELADQMEEFGRQAVSAAGGRLPLLLVLARPSVPTEDFLLRCALPDPYTWIATELVKGPLSRPLSERWSPDFEAGVPVDPRAGGWIIEGRNVQLELHEDGVLRLSTSALTYPAEPPTVNDIAINGLVKRVVMTASVIGERCSYFGSWHFSVLVVGLRGRQAETARRGLRAGMPPYAEDGYEQTTAATFEELAASPDEVVQRLLGRLNRAFGGSAARIP